MENGMLEHEMHLLLEYWAYSICCLSRIVSGLSGALLFHVENIVWSGIDLHHLEGKYCDFTKGELWIED